MARRFCAMATAVLALPVLFIVAGASLAQDAGDCPASSIQFAVTALQVESPLRLHNFTVELAESPEQRSRGLMCRTALAEDGGMLFDYGWPQRFAMWMRNTLIPLDMLFVDDRGSVFAIVRNATPRSEAIINPGAPARAVIELQGGTVDRLDIRRGDRINHPIFGRPLK